MLGAWLVTGSNTTANYSFAVLPKAFFTPFIIIFEVFTHQTHHILFWPTSSCYGIVYCFFESK